MATVKGTSRAPLTRKRIALYVGSLFLLILIALLAYNFSFIKGQMSVGTAYGARVACSCHYVGGRDIEDCRKDFEPGALMIASATAEFREGWGCVMLTEAELQAD